MCSNNQKKKKKETTVKMFLRLVREEFLIVEFQKAACGSPPNGQFVCNLWPLQLSSDFQEKCKTTCDGWKSQLFLSCIENVTQFRVESDIISAPESKTTWCFVITPTYNLDFWKSQHILVIIKDNSVFNEAHVHYVFFFGLFFYIPIWFCK